MVEPKATSRASSIRLTPMTQKSGCRLTWYPALVPELAASILLLLKPIVLSSV